MTNNLSSFCDDFYVDMCVNTELELPAQRDTILTFFERIQKQYPAMGNFYRRQESEYCLEENQNSGRYRWVTLETDRLASGAVNPSELEQAYELHRFVLDLAPYMLGLSPLDIGSLDLIFAMEFDCPVSHDEVISELVLGSSPFGCFCDLPQAKTVGFSPAIVVALTEDCHTQARISIESKTSIYDPRKQKSDSEEAIGLSLTIRQYPHGSEKFLPLDSFVRQCRLAEELLNEKVLPSLVRPLSNLIAQKRLS